MIARRGASAAARRRHWRLPTAALLGGLLSSPALSGDGVETISPQQFADLLARGVTVVDVRRADEWRSTGIVVDSRLITAYDADGRLAPDFAERVSAAVAKDEPVVLICRTGNRSGRAATLLREQLGYQHVYNVAGGVQSWQGEQRPLTPCAGC